MLVVDAGEPTTLHDYPIRIQTNDFALDLRQEPYEVMLHVRICAGDGWQQPFLPRCSLMGITIVGRKQCQVLR